MVVYLNVSDRKAKCKATGAANDTGRVELRHRRNQLPAAPGHPLHTADFVLDTALYC